MLGAYNQHQIIVGSLNLNMLFHQTKMWTCSGALLMLSLNSICTSLTFHLENTSMVG
uniref:Uncharacterized protein n=1 Tax=Arundo donax TaxID=35708 RepID=A0A0A9DZS6_ARUDO